MRTAELGVVIVVVVVRASPNGAWAEGDNSKNPHQTLGQAGMGQYRFMLLIVVNHEKAEHKESAEKAADELAGKVEVGESSRKGRRQEKRGRKNAPPTPHGGIQRVRFGCQYQLFARSQMLSLPKYWTLSRSLSRITCNGFYSKRK